MPDVVMRHDEHCVHSFLASFVATLCNASKIFSKCSLPHLSCGRVVHYIFATGDSATRDGAHHGAGIMFHVNPHLGMLHERTGCVYRAEGGLLAEGE